MNAQSKAIRTSVVAPGIEHIVLDMPNKSANVLTAEFFAELDELLGRLESSPPSLGIVISSAKAGIYIAGADVVAISNTLHWNQQQIIEFCRRGQSLFDRLANLPCVGVAAIHGVCVGGGLEFALSFDSRVASNDRKTLLGLPEVKLGLIPGWAGTVRTPRLIGLQPAIDLVTTGRLISAEQSLVLGLVDSLVESDKLIEAATTIVRELFASQSFLSRRQQRRQATETAHDFPELKATFTAAIQSNRELHPQAPLVALHHMLDSASDPFEVACAKNGVAMSKVYGSEPSAGLLNAFFINERIKKLGRFTSVVPATIQYVGIVGAGVMGGDIAQICPGQQAIKVYDADTARANKVVELCNSRPKVTALAQVACELADVAPSQLVIESIVEDLSAKRQVLLAIEQQVASTAILASNTSVISIGELAANLRRPENFCGLHFCYPAKIRRLVEVVRGPQTSTETMAAVCEWVRSCGKIPLLVGDAPGFIINRLLCPMFNEAGHLLTQGCSLSSIENAMREFGFAMGPLEFMDAIGLDTLFSAGAYLIPRLTTPTEPSLLLHAMNKAGWKGRKSSRGFYSYATTNGSPQSNELLDALITQYSRPSAAALESSEIVRRLLMVMVNQAADVLAENVVNDSAEIDLAMLHGAGFPDHRGGLLFWARRQGLAKLIAEMKHWGAAPGNTRRYRISPNLVSMARENQS